MAPAVPSPTRAVNSHRWKHVRRGAWVVQRHAVLELLRGTGSIIRELVNDEIAKKQRGRQSSAAIS